MATALASEPSFKVHEFSFPVPKSLHAILHIHISVLGGCTLVHVTTTTIGETTGSSVPLGSFVYAMPDVRKRCSAANCG